MSVQVSCPRCGAGVHPPDLMDSAWRCADCGPVYPLHTPAHLDLDVAAAVFAHAAGTPVWVPWPLPTGWLVTGLAWAGDERSGARATVVALTGPAPVSAGPADLLLIAEEPGVGLGTRLAGLSGPDPGRYLDGLDHAVPHAKVRANGWPTPLWSVGDRDDRSAFVGEAHGLWLFAVAWPASAGYLLAEELLLCDAAAVPGPLVFGAPSPYLPPSG
jgi:hypothetical protein